MAICTLLLVGGQSSRMGQAKHLLRLPNSCLLFDHMVDILKSAGPVAISARRDQGISHPRVIIDSQSIGPASGLLAAHRYDATAHWLVVAIDYPLIQPAALQQLLDEFQEPVTCFQNGDGYCEPLLGIWSPGALAELAKNVAIGIDGPIATFRQCKGTALSPKDSKWTVNCNTPAEWEAAMQSFSP